MPAQVRAKALASLLPAMAFYLGASQMLVPPLYHYLAHPFPLCISAQMRAPAPSLPAPSFTLTHSHPFTPTIHTSPSLRPGPSARGPSRASRGRTPPFSPAYSHSHTQPPFTPTHSQGQVRGVRAGRHVGKRARGCGPSWLKVAPNYYTIILYYYTTLLCYYTTTLRPLRCGPSWLKVAPNY